MSLVVSTVDLFLRRLTRTAARPRLRAPVYGGILGLGTTASAWFSVTGYRDAVAAAPTEASFTDLIAVAIGFLTAGPVMLLVDGARDRSRRFQRSVASLPLSARRLSLLVWAPPALFGAAVIVWLTVPTFFTFLGSGLSAIESLAVTLVPLVIGASVALLAMTAAALALRGARWDVVRPPVAYLLWTVLVILEFVVCGAVLEGRDDPLAPWLLLPRVVASVAAAEPLDPASLLAAPAVLVGAIAIAWLAGRGGSADLRQRPLRLEWRGRSRLVGELLLVLRDPNALANILSALVLCTVAALVMNRLPEALQVGAFRVGAAIVCLCAAVPIRGIRGIHPARVTTAQLLGMGVVGWMLRQFAIAALIFCALTVPLWFLPGVEQPTSLAIACGMALTALGCSVLIGAVLLVRADDSVGQVVGALAVLAAGGAAEWAIGDAPPSLAPLLGAATALLAAVGAIAVEHLRWRYRSPGRPAH